MDRFYLLYFFLSFLNFLEYEKIYFLEALRENVRMALTSSNVGFARLIVFLIF